MAAVSETIVREYFELHGFFIRQQRKYVAPSRREDEEVDFFVLNPHQVASDKPLPFVLTSNEVPMIARAVVVVKGWHTESFSSAVLAHAPEIFRFVDPPVFQRAAKTFGGGASPTKILVVPALPQNIDARDQSIELLNESRAHIGSNSCFPGHTVANVDIANRPGRGISACGAWS